MENIPVTIDAVKNIKSFNGETLDTVGQNKLKNAHKKLLVEASKQELGVEVGRVFDTNMTPLCKTAVGLSGHIALPNPDIPYIAVHTHPDCNILSPGDLKRFSERENMRLLTADCHNGHIFAVEKTNLYDAAVVKTLVSDLNESSDLLKAQYEQGEISGRELIESVDFLVRACLSELEG